MDCLFCKIVRGEIPNYTVYEDDLVLAFLDIHPCAKGHTVVVPKQHFASLLEMDSEDWAQMMTGLQGTIRRVQGALNPEGINIGINDRSAAGQAVSHVHWHIIPRSADDGGGSMHSIVRGKEPVDVEKVAQLFK